MTTPDNPTVPNVYHATLTYLPLQGAQREVDHAYIRAERNPHATARARFGNPKGRYRVRVRPATARELGMERITR